MNHYSNGTRNIWEKGMHKTARPKKRLKVMFKRGCTISFSKEWLADIDRLSVLLGSSPQAYGYIPATLRYSVTLSLAAIEKAAEVTPGLKEGELNTFFRAIALYRKMAELEEKAKAAALAAQNVTADNVRDVTKSNAKAD